MFEWIKDTALGRTMAKWAVVWQPAYDDIDKWTVIGDIGKFSDDTLVKWKEAWATVPSPVKKEIYNVFQKLQKIIAPEILMKIVELYLNAIGKK